MQQLLSRAKKMYLAWTLLVCVGGLIVAHSAGWLAKDVFPRLSTENPLVVESLLLTAAFIIFGQVVPESKFKPISMYLAGVLTGIGFLVAFEGVGGLGVMYVVAANQLYAYGKAQAETCA